MGTVVQIFGAASPLSLSESLKTLIAGREIRVMGDAGYETREGPWAAPAAVPPGVAVEARAAADSARGLLAPAGVGSVKRWLIALGNAVAGNASESEAEARVGAMLTLLDDLPAGVFTKKTLKTAASAFKFFPSFSELSRLLDAEAAALRERVRRLDVIASTPSKPIIRRGENDRPTGPRAFSPVVEEIMRRFRTGEHIPQADLAAARGGA